MVRASALCEAVRAAHSPGAPQITPSEPSHGSGGPLNRQLAARKDALGAVNQLELVALEGTIRDRCEERHRSLRAAFLHLEVGGVEGRIGARSLLPVLLRLGLEAPQQLVEALVAKYDTDGSGTIDFQEFAKAMEAAEGWEHQLTAASPAKRSSPASSVSSMTPHCPRCSGIADPYSCI